MEEVPVKNEYPPNISLIRQVLTPPEHAVFAYAPHVYNPSGKKLLKDILWHEKVHIDRQGNNPDAWYLKYLTDKDFRLKEELMAYGAQLKLAKEHGVRGKTMDWLLDNMSNALSSDYGLDITHAEARSKIRNYANNE